MKLTIRIAAALLAFGALIVALAYLAGFFTQKIAPDRVAATAQPTQQRELRTFTVQMVTEPVLERAAGTVRSRTETVVSARITGTITSVNVRVGDSVRVGELLVRLDVRELESRLKQQQDYLAGAQARVNEARPSFDRMRALLDRGVVPKAEFDRARAVLRTAEAERARAEEAVREAETGLSYATILAPIDGRVVDRLAEPGDMAVPAESLLRLYDPGRLRLEANVRESLGSRLNPGDPLEVHIGALDAELQGTVEEIVPLADPGSRTFLIKVALPELKNLYPGMFGRLLLPTGSAQRIYVPAGAVEHAGQLAFVTVVSEQGPQRRFVREGKRTGNDQVEILSGLAPGDRLIVADDK